MERELKITDLRTLLNQYKEDNHLTIPSLAEKIGMNDSSLQIILSGKRNITLEMISFSYNTFGKEKLNNLISNEKEDKMIKDYLNPITRNEERLLIRQYCRENETTIEELAKKYQLTQSVFSRMITREFSANPLFYQIIKDLGFEKELEDLIISRQENIKKLKKAKLNTKEENIFLYNNLILENVLKSEKPIKIFPKTKKEKKPSIRNQIGELGNQLRQENNFSFQDMSKILNCSPSTIQSMEVGKIPFNIDYYNILIKYGYEEKLNKEIDNLKREIIKLKDKENLTKEEKNQVRSYQNYLTKTKKEANKRTVQAKSIINAIEESSFIKLLTNNKSIQEISKEMNVPLSSLHAILQGKQIADTRFYTFLINQGFKEELNNLLNQRTPKYTQISDFLDKNKTIYYKSLKDEKLISKYNPLESYQRQETLNIKKILSDKDYIFYKSYRNLFKALQD